MHFFKNLSIGVFFAFVLVFIFNGFKAFKTKPLKKNLVVDVLELEKKDGDFSDFTEKGHSISDESKTKKVIKLKNLEKTEDLSVDSNIFKIGDVVGVEFKDSFKPTLEKLLLKYGTIENHAFYNGKILKKSLNPKLSFKNSFVYISDLKSFVQSEKHKTGIIRNHFIVTAGFSHKYLCLESMVDDQRSIRPKSYLDGNPCANYIYIAPDSQSEEEAVSRVSHPKNNFNTSLKVSDLAYAFGENVNLKVVSCSNEQVKAFESICPKSAKEPEFRLSKVQNKLL